MSLLKHLAIIGFSVVVIGCATNNEFQVASFNTELEASYPPISVFSDRPSEAFSTDCSDFDAKSMIDHCSFNAVNLSALRNALSATKLFSHVAYANKELDYRLVVVSARYNHESGSDIGSAMLAGATLLLAPVSTSSTVRVEARLMWRDVLLETFDISVPFTQKTSIMNLNNDAQMDLASSVSSHLIKELQTHDAFREGYVAEKISASDYLKDLVLPVELNDFVKDGVRIYEHPFLGAQTRYSHKVFGFDSLDVFVYPVRSHNLDDTQGLLMKEFESARKDIDLMYRELGVLAPTFGDVKQYKWYAGINGYDVLRLQGEFLDQQQVPHITHAYLSLRGDKFVKVRATFSKEAETWPDADQLVQQVMNEISVPEESLFMARMRKRWRDSSVYE